MQIDRETTNRWSHEAHRCLRNSQVDYDMTDVLMFVAQRAAEAEREINSKTRPGTPRRLQPVGSGALLSEQQFCFDKGFMEGAAAVRAAIRARGIIKEQA